MLEPLLGPLLEPLLEPLLVGALYPQRMSVRLGGRQVTEVILSLGGHIMRGYLSCHHVGTV